jgi:hypothetical protein
MFLFLLFPKNTSKTMANKQKEGKLTLIHFRLVVQPLPSDLQGDSSQCIYGTNQLTLEYVLIDAQLKGPCWLNIKKCGSYPGMISNTFEIFFLVYHQ